MSDLTNPTSLPNGYKNGQQAPLDGKRYFENEEDMLTLSGVGTLELLRPLQWYKEMIVTNRENGKRYVWRNQSEGLIDGGYTYPADVVSFGLDYSGQVYNWVELYVLSIQDVASSMVNVGEVIEVYKGFNETTNKHEFRKIKSDTLNVALSEDGNSISVEVTFPADPNANAVRDFIVDTRYTGDDELGTTAKPYKTLDKAIEDYIGAGDLGDPDFANSRIFCVGGESHTFTRNLSIRNLVLEVEEGTEIVFIGGWAAANGGSDAEDLYMVDMSLIQAAFGGVGSQNGNCKVQLKGSGIIESKTLLVKMVHSGHDRDNYTSDLWYRNLVEIEDLTLRSVFNEEFFTPSGVVKRSDGSDWVTSGVVNRFYEGDINIPVIISMGQGLGGTLDNNSQKPLTLLNVEIISLTQIPIKIMDSVLLITDSAISLETITGWTIVEPGIITGGVLITEDPALSYTLPTFRTGLCLIEADGRSDIFIDGKFDYRGYAVTRGESVFNILSSDVDLDITSCYDLKTTGGTDFEDYIKVGNTVPDININNLYVNKKLHDNTTGKLINTNNPPFIKANLKNCVFPFRLDDSVDLTKNNTVSVSNTFESNIIESLITYAVIDTPTYPTYPKGTKYKLVTDDTIYAVS